MIEALERFIQILRTAGVRVSPAEGIDAARAVQVVGVEPRALFRAALKSCLCKSRRDAPRFDRAFDEYFKAPAAAPAPRRGKAGTGAAETSPHRGATRRKPAPEDPEAPPGAGGRPAAEPRQPRLREGRLRVLVQPESRNARHIGHAPAARPGFPATPVKGRASNRPRPRASPQAQAPPDPRAFDLSVPLTTSQERVVAREVPRLVRQIRLRAGRRLGAARAGRLWTSRLLRDNIGTEGVPFSIPFRARRPRRPRIVLLVDVSWSVMSASTFFLLMAREFLGRGARVSIHFFVDRCVDATDKVARWKGPAQMPLARLLDGVPNLDPKAASDYGRAFFQALRARGTALGRGGRDVVLVVLGDARSNRRDPQAWAFDELASRCRRVIWLNPEPAARWDTGDSDLSLYLAACDVVCEARDLEGLARGVAEIARNR